MNRVVIFAGGVGQRMKSNNVPKQFLLAHGKEIIVHTIEHFQGCSEIDSIVVVCLEQYIEFMEELIKKYKLSKVVSVVSGGNCGQQSIYFGIKELVRLYGENNDDIVLIHDGVRPLINEKVILDNIQMTKKEGNSITVNNSIETVVLLNENDLIDKVMDRKFCRNAKAPQTFYLKDIYNNHLKAISQNKLDFIDSAMLMQYYGAVIHTVIGPVENIKITTPMDYFLFKAILEARENNQLRLEE